MTPFRLRPPPGVGRCLPVLLALVGALAAPARAEDGERRRIVQEREAIEARYAARERECRERFVVTSCVEDAKRDRRRGLDALRTRQLKLDEEGRRDRAAARQAELAAKAVDDARREQERAARAASAPASAGAPSARLRAPRGVASDARRTPRDARDRPVPAARRLGIKPTQRGSDEERREREERSRASYEARLRRAAEHRQEVVEKAAKRGEERRPATPLPVPGASAPR